MKVSNDLLIGIAIGAGAALLLSRKSTTVGPVIISPKSPLPKMPMPTKQNNIAGSWYPRRAYVADLRQTYIMPAWYAA